jgi:hypothetical protein
MQRIIIRRLALVAWLFGAVNLVFFSYHLVHLAWENLACESVFKEEAELLAQSAKIFQEKTIAIEKEIEAEQNSPEFLRNLNAKKQKEIARFGFALAEIEPIDRTPIPPPISDLPRRANFDNDLQKCYEVRIKTLDEKYKFGIIGLGLLLLSFVLSGYFFRPPKL